MAYKQPSSGLPFKELGSSPAKNMPHEANGIPPGKAAMMNKRHAEAEHPHDLKPEGPTGPPAPKFKSPAKQTKFPESEASKEVKEETQTKRKKKLADPNTNVETWKRTLKRYRAAKNE